MRSPAFALHGRDAVNASCPFTSDTLGGSDRYGRMGFAHSELGQLLQASEDPPNHPGRLAPSPQQLAVQPFFHTDVNFILRKDSY